MLLKNVWWFLKQLFTGQFSSCTVFLLDRLPRLSDLLMRLFPLQHLWVYARHEWLVCREFNDGPDECYWPWKKWWQMAKDISGYGKEAHND